MTPGVSEASTASRAPYALVAVVAAVQLALTARWILQAPSDVGWDLHVTCAGLAAITHGADPYLAGPGPFFYPYLFHVGFLSAPICALSPAGSMTFAWIYVTLVIASGTLLARSLGVSWPHAALLGAVGPGMLEAAHWMILTGNVAVLEVPLAAGVVLFHRRRLALSGAVFGAMASFKLLPVVGLLAYPFAVTKRERAAPALVSGIITFAAIVAGNLAVMGETRANFFAQLFGNIHGRYSATGEGAYGPTDPNLFAFAARFANALGLHFQNVSATGIALLFLILGASLMAIRQASDDKDRLWRTRLFCAVLVAVNLALFRVKPYAYITLVPFVLVCCVTAERRVNAILLAIGVIASPVSAMLPLPHMGRLLHVPAAYATALPGIGEVFHEYAQLCGLLVLLGAILVASHVELRSAGRRAVQP